MSISQDSRLSLTPGLTELSWVLCVSPKMVLKIDGHLGRYTQHPAQLSSVRPSVKDRRPSWEIDRTPSSARSDQVLKIDGHLGRYTRHPAQLSSVRPSVKDRRPSWEIYTTPSSARSDQVLKTDGHLGRYR